MRNAVTQGWIPGPRMQVAGPHLLPGHGAAKPAPSVPSPFGYGVDQPLWQDVGNVNSPWLARAAVRERHYYGVDWIKIYSTNDFSGSGYVGNRGIFRPDGTMNLYPVMTLEETQAAVDEAHRNGLKVTCPRVRRRGPEELYRERRRYPDAPGRGRHGRRRAGRGNNQAVESAAQRQTAPGHADAVGPAWATWNQAICGPATTQRHGSA